LLQHYIIAAVVSYVVGGIPFGLLIAKSKGIELRKVGSGNIGATNVYRAIGKKEGALTLLLDLAKGSLVVAVFTFLFQDTHYIAIVSGISAVLGHDFSAFLLFKGGKGVATSYGVSLPIYPVASLIGMFVWLAVLFSTKYSSLAALLSFLIATLIALSSPNYATRLFFIFLYILMLFKHRENLKRLFNKEENKIKI